MKTRITLIIIGLVLISGIIPAVAKQIEVPVAFERRNMSGPRFGVTYVAGDTELYRELANQDIGRVVSQFGWHFERQVIPEGDGPQFVIQFVPMVAAVEYGKFVPGATLAMGIRMPRGWEFGMGPNIVATRNDEDATKARTSLILAFGKSLNYGGVSIPINLAMSTEPDGNRFSLIFGYAIGKTTKTVEVPDDELEELHGSVSNNQWDGLR
ncbi:MAG: hypothetical protein ABFS42_12980 [Candidatus Krumholzibacteriota bacterium]